MRAAPSGIVRRKTRDKKRGAARDAWHGGRGRVKRLAARTQDVCLIDQREREIETGRDFGCTETNASIGRK